MKHNENWINMNDMEEQQIFMLGKVTTDFVKLNANANYPKIVQKNRDLLRKAKERSEHSLTVASLQILAALHLNKGTYEKIRRSIAKQATRKNTYGIHMANLPAYQVRVAFKKHKYPTLYPIPYHIPYTP